MKGSKRSQHSENFPQLKEINLQYNKITNEGWMAFFEDGQNFLNLHEI
jgi:hypothetical protein